MRIFIVALLLVVSVRLVAQTIVDKTVPYLPGQTITMHFDYPELITVSTWEKNEIAIHGTVDINGGDNNDAFRLTNATSGSVVTVINEIKDFDKIPKRITVSDGAKKIVFRTNEDVTKYERETGRHFQSKSYGVEVEIHLEIKVPRNVVTHIESVYGMVEIKNFTGPLTVESTYGGVDAALRESATGELSAETHYGEIYTNLTTRFSGKATDRDFHTYVSAKPGTGPSYTFISRYGNVYIRKSD